MVFFSRKNHLRTSPIMWYNHPAAFHLGGMVRNLAHAVCGLLVAIGTA
jgi:hypothetical protein